ncbi:branched-chain amino acid ABC transporter substrate-binding protein [Sporolactobacillus sp. THM7-7]|nr:branched-chain amino acid ABC transporter substrate-binding protein [Sporolactobacillus sp. THM7-7]
MRTLFLPILVILALVISGCAVSPGSGSGNGSKKQTVKIAFIGPLTGGNSRIGLGGRNSARLAVYDANHNKNNKYHYELVEYDDENTTQAGNQVALKASSDPSVIGGIAHYGSVVALATVDTYHKAGFPTMIWGAVHPDITLGNDYKEIFRVPGTQIDQNKQAAEFVTKLGFKKVGVLYDTTDYGRGHFKYFKENLQKLGGQIVAEMPVQPDQQDLNAELTKIQAKKPDLIWFAGLAPEGVRVKKQMDAMNIKTQFMGVSGLVNEEYNSALGAEGSEGSLAIIDGAPTSSLPGGEKFMKDYKARKYSEAPEAYGPFAYVSTDLMIQAIEKVGPDRKKVTNWLDTKVKNIDSMIGKVTFNEHGQNDMPLFTPMVSQDGKWVPYAESEYQTGKRKLPGKK